MKNKKKNNKVLRNIFIGLAIFLIILTTGFYIYTLDYYKADAYAVEINKTVNVDHKESGKYTIFTPEAQNDQHIGFIFYPGGKVDSIAYSPLLKQLTDKGITCVLVKMPFNLAVFDVNAADKVYDLLPNIKQWYLGGHSLGGAMASSYVEKNSKKLDGLVLMGAYPLNDTGLSTIVIYGSEDYGLDMDKLSFAKNQVRIEGGNHAYFGNYGEQKGDGVAAITREDEQKQAVKAIISFMMD